MIRPVIDGKTLHGVEELEHTSSIVNLYPNPVSNMLNVSISENTEIIQTCIFDLMGRRVWQSGFTKQIPVGNLNDGLYFISLTTAQGQVITQKFIISK